MTERSDGPRTVRDKIFELLKDGHLYSAKQISDLPGVGQGQWQSGISDLVDFGYEFRRERNSLSMRRRPSYEQPQDVGKLLRGIDATVDDYRGGRRGEPVVEALGDDALAGDLPEERPRFENAWEEPDTEAEGFRPEADSFAMPAEGDRLVLSDDGRSCVLPAGETLTATMAILAKKNMGKTYLAMSIAEEMLGNPRPMPFVAVDPTGVWWGLAATRDGMPAAHQLVVLGGRYGRPLRPEDGKITADAVVKVWPCPFVLDLSDMEPEEQHLFVAEFLSRLYSKNRLPIHIFLDEADEFAPQQPDSATFKHQKRCLSIVDRVVRRGRIRGLGMTLISQRPAVVNKNPLSQIEKMFFLSMSGPQDLDAAENWMKAVVKSGERSTCLQAMPTLKRGECFCVGMAAGVIPVVRFAVRVRHTYDASKTPSIDDRADVVEPTLVEPAAHVLESLHEIYGWREAQIDDEGS